MKAMEDAGLLTAEGEIPDFAYDAIIDGIVSITESGMINIPDGFACSYKTSIVPQPGSLPKDIKNRKKYPEFHSIVMKKYRETLRALNLESQFLAPFPFWHPVALGLKLGAKIPSVDLPSIDLGKLPTFTPDLMLSIIVDLGVDINLPSLLLKAPKLAGFSIPGLGVDIPKLDLAYFDKYKFEFWQPSLVNLFIDISTKMIDPKFVVSLLKVPPDICVIVDAAAESLPSDTKPGEIVKAAIDAHHTIYTSKLLPVVGAHIVIGRGSEIAEAMGLKKNNAQIPTFFVPTDNTFRMIDYEEGYGEIGTRKIIYLDSVGYPSCGWGHLIVKKKYKKIEEFTNANPSWTPLLQGAEKNKEKLFSIFKDDVKRTILEMNKLYFEGVFANNKPTGIIINPKKIKQNHYDVLIDLCFNYGPGAWVPNQVAKMMMDDQFSRVISFLNGLEDKQKIDPKTKLPIFDENGNPVMIIHNPNRRKRNAKLFALENYDPTNKDSLAQVYTDKGKLQASNGPIEEFITWRKTEKGYVNLPAPIEIKDKLFFTAEELNTDFKSPPAPYLPAPPGYKAAESIPEPVQKVCNKIANGKYVYGYNEKVQVSNDTYIVIRQPHFDNHPIANALIKQGLKQDDVNEVPSFWHQGATAYEQIVKKS